VETLPGTLLVDHRLDDGHGRPGGDVDEPLPVARQLVPQLAGRLELGIVGARDAFLCGGVVVASRADLDVADDVVAAPVQCCDRGRGVLDAVDVVNHRVVPGWLVAVVGGDAGAHQVRVAGHQRLAQLPHPV